MFKILVDTCVWLDLAKDHEQLPLIGVIEELVEMKELSLIVPQTVLDEFLRNKDRVSEETGRSLSSHFKLVKNAVSKFGDPATRETILHQLSDVDHRIPLLGASSVSDAMERIEQLLSASVTAITDEIKLRAAERAIHQRAPFHRKKNSIGDALLIETYADFVTTKPIPSLKFAFVTHNVHDFSSPTGSNKLPHPDIAYLFSKRKSLYFISLAEAIHKVKPDLVSDLMIEHDEWSLEPRTLSEIVAVENELREKIWYDRHQSWIYKIETGEHKIVEQVNPEQHDPKVTPRYVYEGAKESARKVEERYGIDHLGPWSDFEWGMLNGKLSALRWVLGEDWDMLDT